jgi:hypothetical protein
MRYVMLTALVAMAAGVHPKATRRRVPTTLAPGGDSVVAAQAERKVVFLHVQDSGGTSFVGWMGRVHAMCARNATLEEVSDQSDKKYLLDLNDGESVSDVKDATAEEAGGVEKLAQCGPARKLCTLNFKNKWKRSKCTDQVERYVDSGCTFVELHHFDISVADAFRQKGYEVMTLVRNPVHRLKSEMTKKLHGSGSYADAFDNYTMIYSPDNAIRLLTSCDAQQYKQDKDLATSCTLEFQKTQSGEVANAISAHIENNLNVRNASNATVPEYCSKEWNVTKETYEHLYSVAKRNVDQFSFVGILERLDLTLKVFMKHFGVGLPTMPVAPDAAPPYCISPGGFSIPCPKAFANMSMELDETEFKGLMQYDYQLWCDASSKLTEQAVNLDFGYQANTEHDLAPVNQLCGAPSAPAPAAASSGSLVGKHKPP